MITTLMIVTISTVTPIAKWTLIIGLLLFLKPTPAWAINPTDVVYLSCPCWHYLLCCGQQQRRIGQIGMKIVLFVLQNLRFLTWATYHEHKQGLQSFCPLAGVSISDIGRATVLLRGGFPSIPESLYAFIYHFSYNQLLDR